MLLNIALACLIVIMIGGFFLKAKTICALLYKVTVPIPAQYLQTPAYISNRIKIDNLPTQKQTLNGSVDIMAI